MLEKINKLNLEQNKRFKEFRNLLDLEQDDLAAVLKVSQKTISRIENGHQALSQKHRVIMVKKLGLNGNWYDTGVGNPRLGKQERTLVHDVGEIRNDIDKLQVQIDNINRNIDKLVRMIQELKED